MSRPVFRWRKGKIYNPIFTTRKDYPAHSRKAHDREQKKIAEDVIDISRNLNIPPWEIKKFFELYRSLREHTISVWNQETGIRNDPNRRKNEQK